MWGSPESLREIKALVSLIEQSQAQLPSAEQAIQAQQSTATKKEIPAQYKPDVTRVVLDLNEASAFNITKVGDRLHVTFGNAAPQISERRAAPVEEPAKPAPTPEQIPVVADNASWKMPQEASQGATAVIQPGGSMRDAAIIKAADEAGLALVLTCMRHFRH